MKKVLWICLLVPFLASCWDTNESERMYYLHGVGIDYVDGQYELYAQIIDFTNVAKMEQSNPEAMQAEVGFAKGRTVNEAFIHLYQSLDMRLFLGHLSYIVFSEEALKDGRANSVLNTFNRYRESRYQIWVYATDENLKDVLLVTPVLNKSISLSKLANPLNSFEQGSVVLPIDFRQFIIYLDEPPHEVAIPFITLRENWENENGKNPVTYYAGVSIISEHDYKGKIIGHDMNGLQWMSKETVRSEITYELGGGAFTANIENVDVNIQAHEKNGELVFDVEVTCNAIVSGFNAEITRKAAKKTIKEQMEKEIRKTYELALEQEMDIYQLSLAAYKQKNKLWKKLQQKGKVPLKSSSLRHVDVYIEKITAARKDFTETID